MLLNQTRINLPLEKNTIISSPCVSNINLWMLTNLEELSFLTVLALPKASITGLVCTTWTEKFQLFIKFLTEIFLLIKFYLILKRCLLFGSSIHNSYLFGWGRGTNKGKVGNNLLGVLSFTCSGLSSNKDGLVLALWRRNWKVLVCFVCSKLTNRKTGGGVLLGYSVFSH